MKIVKLIIVILLGFVERCVCALVLCKIWGWWAVPFWPNVPVLTFAPALGIGLIWSIINYSNSIINVRILIDLKHGSDEDWSDVYWSVISITVLWPMMLGTAYILKLIVL